MISETLHVEVIDGSNQDRKSRDLKLSERGRQKQDKVQGVIANSQKTNVCKRDGQI